MPSAVRRASQRVVSLTGRHRRHPDDPVVVLARHQLAEEAIRAEIARRMDGLPPLPADARARLAKALEAR